MTTQDAPPAYMGLTRYRLTCHRIRGRTFKQIAKRVGMEPDQIKRAVRRLHADVLSQPNLTLSEVAAQLGIPVRRLEAQVERGKVQAGKWGRLQVFTPQQIEAARRLCVPLLESHPEHLRVEDAAKLLNLSVSSAWRVLQKAGVPSIRAQRTEGGQTHRLWQRDGVNAVVESRRAGSPDERH